MTRWKKRFSIVLILTTFLLVNVTFSDSGRLNRYGCHHDEITAYYHCHVVRAPEYKAPEYKGDGKELEAIIIATAVIGLALMLFINREPPKAENTTTNFELKDDEIKFKVSYNF